jgi:hypothetical protein
MKAPFWGVNFLQLHRLAPVQPRHANLVRMPFRHGGIMNIQSVLKQIFTGNDNETVAWGRVMGSAVFVVFVVVTPQVVLVMLAPRLMRSPGEIALSPTERTPIRPNPGRQGLTQLDTAARANAVRTGFCHGGVIEYPVCLEANLHRERQ